MDFQKRTDLSGRSEHNITQPYFPEKSTLRASALLTGDDRQFLLKYMSSIRPKVLTALFCRYHYWPAYCKFLLLGQVKTVAG